MTLETPDAPAPARPRRRRASPRRVTLLFALVAVSWVAIDQITKVIAVEFLTGRVVDLGVVNLLLLRNPNAAFGIPGFPGLFIIITIVVTTLVIRALPRTDSASLAVAYALVVGGAIGNALDRVFRDPGFPAGAVVDWIQFGGFMSWFPVFNLADSGITIGASLLVVLLARQEREEQLAAAAVASDPSVRPDPRPPRVERWAAGDDER